VCCFLVLSVMVYTMVYAIVPPRFC
jgi:hypothetical protein